MDKEKAKVLAWLITLVISWGLTGYFFVAYAQSGEMRHLWVGVFWLVVSVVNAMTISGKARPR